MPAKNKNEDDESALL